MNIAILNLQELEELNYTVDCLELIHNEIIDPQIDIFAGEDFNEKIDNSYIRNLFKIDIKNLHFSDLSMKYSQIRSYSRLYKYHIAVDTECSLKSAILAYLLSGRTAGFKKSGFMGYLISKLYDEVIPYDDTKGKKELTFMLLAKTFGFQTQQSIET